MVAEWLCAGRLNSEKGHDLRSGSTWVKPVSSDGLVRWYACDEGSGTTLHNRSSSGGEEGLPCSSHDECGEGLFCAVECFTGNGCNRFSLLEDVCQPCSECHYPSDSVTDSCSVCGPGGSQSQTVSAVFSEAGQGAASASPTWVVDSLPGGRPRYVLEFAGDSYAVASGLGLPSGDAARSLLGWFKVTAPDSNVNGPFGWGTGHECGSSWYIWIAGSGDANLDYWCHEEGVNPVADSSDFHHTWLHLAITWDGHENRVYKNGIFAKRGTPDERPATPSGADGSQFIIGGNPGVTSSGHEEFFHGRVADIAIYSRALSEDEIRTWYNNGKGNVSLSGGGCTHEPFFQHGEHMFECKVYNHFYARVCALALQLQTL